MSQPYWIEADDDELASARPIAWGYVSTPTFYPRAEVQWKQWLEEIAAREGYMIARWFSDNEGRKHGLRAMLEQMPGSEVRALFIPSPSALWTLTEWEYMNLGQLQEELGRPIFVISQTNAPLLVVHDPRITVGERFPRPEPQPRRGLRLWPLTRRVS